MVWAKFRVSEVPPEELVVEVKRYPGEKLLLVELVDYYLYAVKQFFRDCRNALDVVNKVIVEVKYPLDWRGYPTNFHYTQAFKYLPNKCLVTLKNELDFWQKSSETVLFRYGDCEDSSILAAAGHQILGYPWFVAFGEVYLNDKLLGGHGWEVFRGDDGVWRLNETTLDEPIKTLDELPRVDLSTNVWWWGRVKYVAKMLWNLEEIWVWVESGEKMSVEVVGKVLREYMARRGFEVGEKRRVEREKLRALGEGIGRRVKGVERGRRRFRWRWFRW